MDAEPFIKKNFTTRLAAWHADCNKRSLPWKNEKDPYKIWLSEVILQQTRALQGLPYFERFVAAYPTVKDLAAAGDDDVFRLWQGLGYYNRCRNMLATARIIAGEFDGKFPETYDEIIRLKGIGPYTAAAIASFAFGLPHAVVDGNVYRVLARYFGIEFPTDTSEGKKYFALLAQDLLDTHDSGGHNQAIMDLGATVCTPQKAACDLCPLADSCIAHKSELKDVLPVKSQRISVKKRYFHYLVLKCNDSIWFRKRSERDIWQNLYEPYLIEHTEPMDRNALLRNDQFARQQFDFTELNFVYLNTQRLTHQIIEARFFGLLLRAEPTMPEGEGQWLHKNDIRNKAFPKTVLSFLENNLYF